MLSERDRQRLCEIERGIEAEDPALAALLRTAQQRWGCWRYVLLASVGVVIAVIGAAALNFDVLVLGIGCMAMGIAGMRRHVRVAGRSAWQG